MANTTTTSPPGATVPSMSAGRSDVNQGAADFQAALMPPEMRLIGTSEYTMYLPDMSLNSSSRKPVCLWMIHQRRILHTQLRLMLKKGI